MASEKEVMEKLISDSVILMVKTSLRFNNKIEIRGVICVTVDQAEVSVIHIDRNLKPDDVIKQENCQEITCTTSPNIEPEHPSKKIKLENGANNNILTDASTGLMPQTFTDDLDNQSIFQMPCSSNIILSNSSTKLNTPTINNIVDHKNVSNNNNISTINQNNNIRMNMADVKINSQLVLASPNKKVMDVPEMVSQLLTNQRQNNLQQQQNRNQNIQQTQQSMQQQPQQNMQQQRQPQNMQQNLVKQLVKQQNNFHGNPSQTQQQPNFLVQQQGMRMGSTRMMGTPQKQQMKGQMSTPTTPVQRVYPPQQVFTPQQRRINPNNMQLVQQQQQLPNYNNNMMVVSPRGGRGSRGPRGGGMTRGARGGRGRAKLLNDGWSSVEESGGGGDGFSFGKTTVTQYICNICKGQYKSHSSLLTHQVRSHGRQKKVGMGRKPKNQSASNPADIEYYEDGGEEEEEYGYEDDYAQ